MAATLEPLPKVMAVTCFAFVGGREEGWLGAESVAIQDARGWHRLLVEAHETRRQGSRST